MGVCSSCNIRSLGGNVSASAVSCSVRIVLLVVCTVWLVVVKRVTGPATITAEAGFDAIDELLFGELSDWDWGALIHFHVISGFDSTGGRESPAGATLSLILNGGDITSINPVNTGGPVRNNSNDRCLVFTLLNVGSKSSTCKFSTLIFRPVGVLVVGVDRCICKVFYLIDSFVPLVEVGEALFIFGSNRPSLNSLRIWNLSSWDFWSFLRVCGCSC